ATVTLRNLTPEQITVVASALDSRRRAVASQPMAPAENGVWRTPEPGLVLPANFGNRATSFTVNVIVTTTGTPALKKGVRAGTVSVARGNADPNQPPPPPTF
ncbi:MAG: hypothetical protein K6U89_07040, partial [Chloroflexi bacterium]|nr:hypothetical protein [Chloroflexota bacterium]